MGGKIKSMDTKSRKNFVRIRCIFTQKSDPQQNKEDLYVTRLLAFNPRGI